MIIVDDDHMTAAYRTQTKTHGVKAREALRDRLSEQLRRWHSHYVCITVEVAMFFDAWPTALQLFICLNGPDLQSPGYIAFKRVRYDRSPAYVIIPKYIGHCGSRMEGNHYV